MVLIFHTKSENNNNSFNLKVKLLIIKTSKKAKNQKKKITHLPWRYSWKSNNVDVLWVIYRWQHFFNLKFSHFFCYLKKNCNSSGQNLCQDWIFIFCSREIRTCQRSAGISNGVWRRHLPLEKFVKSSVRYDDGS